MNILITGAAGSGTSTLGRELSKTVPDLEFLDADDFFWLPTNPPYQFKRHPDERLTLLLSQMESKNIVLSGSVTSWGIKHEISFDLIIFLYLETEIRLERLKKRELKKLGTIDDEFIAWASEYDNPKFSGINFVKHQNWLSQQKCRVLKIEGNLSIQERINRVKIEIGFVSDGLV